MGNTGKVKVASILASTVQYDNKGTPHVPTVATAKVTTGASKAQSLAAAMQAACSILPLAIIMGIINPFAKAFGASKRAGAYAAYHAACIVLGVKPTDNNDNAKALACYASAAVGMAYCHATGTWLKGDVKSKGLSGYYPKRVYGLAWWGDHTSTGNKHTQAQALLPLFNAVYVAYGKADTIPKGASTQQRYTHVHANLAKWYTVTLADAKSKGKVQAKGEKVGT